MATLHTLNQSPTGDTLASCLRCMHPGDSLLLLEDGVYAACPPYVEALKTSGCALYVLEADAQARGVDGRLDAAVQATDYPGFVELAASCDRVQSWY